MPLIPATTNPNVSLNSTDGTPQTKLQITQVERVDWNSLGFVQTSENSDDVESGSTSLDYQANPGTVRYAVTTGQSELYQQAIPVIDSENQDTRDTYQENRSGFVSTDTGLLSEFDVKFGSDQVKNVVQGLGDYSTFNTHAWKVTTPTDNLISNGTYGDRYYRVENTEKEYIHVRPGLGLTVAEVVADDESDEEQDVGNTTPGSFALDIDFVPVEKRFTSGQAQGTREDPAWMQIAVGDFLIYIYEQKDEIMVVPANQEDDTQQPRSLRVPGMALGPHGIKYMNLGFIPVWNGLMIIQPNFDQDENKYKVVGIVENDNSRHLEAAITEVLNLDKINNTLVQNPNSVVRNWPTVNMFNPAGAQPAIELTTDITTMDLPTVTWYNCGGNIRYRQIYFTAEQVVLDVHKKAIQPNSEYVIPIFCRNGGTWTLGAYKQFSGNDTEYYAVHCKSGALNEEKRERYPFQTWAYISVRFYDPIKLANLKNQTGTVALGYLNTPREMVVQNISLTRSLDSTNGSITFDQYDQQQALYQQVGALQVALSGGNNTTAGQICSAILWGAGPQVNTDSWNQVTKIVGLHQKLIDLRLMNAPVFDAFNHIDVMQYLCDYAGIQYDSSDAQPYTLRSTYSTQVWAIDFQSGTQVIDAINAICNEADYYWFIDRFGVLRHIQSYSQPADKNTWDYQSYEIIEADFQPDLTNVKNRLVVAGELGGQAQGAGSYGSSTQYGSNSAQNTQLSMGHMWGIPLTIVTTPTFAWSRMAFKFMPGLFTIPELQRIGTLLESRIGKFRWRGQITVPGNAMIELADSVIVTGTELIVVSITHNCDTQGKKWTTSLELEGKSEQYDAGQAGSGTPQGNTGGDDDTSGTGFTQVGSGDDGD